MTSNYMNDMRIMDYHSYILYNNVKDTITEKG